MQLVVDIGKNLKGIQNVCKFEILLQKFQVIIFGKTEKKVFFIIYPQKIIVSYFLTYQRRIKQLLNIDCLEYVFCPPFENLSLHIENVRGLFANTYLRTIVSRSGTGRLLEGPKKKMIRRRGCPGKSQPVKEFVVYVYTRAQILFDKNSRMNANDRANAPPFTKYLYLVRHRRKKHTERERKKRKRERDGTGGNY